MILDTTVFNNIAVILKGTDNQAIFDQKSCGLFSRMLVETFTATF